MASKLVPGGEIPDEFYAAIGKVIVQWAHLESSVNDGIEELAFIDTLSAVCVTSQIAGITRKLDAYMSLAGLRGASDGTIKKLNKFYEKARGLAEQRNRVAHDPWHPPFYEHEEHPKRFEQTAHRKLRIEFVTTQLSDLERLRANIQALEEEFDGLQKAVETDASRGKPRR